MKIVNPGEISIGVYNCGGKLYALEDRCSHDDGPLCEGEWDGDMKGVVVCPRHGSAASTSGRHGALAARVPSGRDVSGRRGRVVQVEVVE